jgi:hypothetical protein
MPKKGKKNFFGPLHRVTIQGIIPCGQVPSHTILGRASISQTRTHGRVRGFIAGPQLPKNHRLVIVHCLVS